MKKKISLLIVTIIFVNIVIYFNYFANGNNVQKISLGKNLGNHVGEIINGKTIVQNYKIDVSELDGVNIMFSTFNRTNVGKTVIQVMQKEKIIYKTELDNSKIKDNDKCVINFDKPIEVSPDIISIVITGNSDMNNGVTVWVDNTIENNNNKLYVGNEYVKGELVMDILGQKKINIVQILFVNIIFICINAFLYKFMKFLTKGQNITV